VRFGVTKSLDGCITGPDDAMDRTTRYGGWTPAAREAVANIGANLAGRRGYDLYEGQDDVKPYGGDRSGPILILTHRPSPLPYDHPGSRSSRTTSSAPWPPSKPPRARMSSCSDLPMSESIERRQ
jgi:hypothetical protein